MSSSRAALAAALTVGSSLVVGCASKPAESFPASPVPAPLSDRQSIGLAKQYLDQHSSSDGPLHVNRVYPMGDGNLVSFRSGFNADVKPPVPTRLVMVDHDGSVRELTFDKN